MTKNGTKKSSSQLIKQSTVPTLLIFVSRTTSYVGEGKVVVLLLLDLCVMFDIVDHTLLNQIQTLQDEIGITGKVLSWFESYLKEGCFNVSQCRAVHACHQTSRCVLVFLRAQSSDRSCIYVMALGRIIRKHDLDYHCYADDFKSTCSSNLARGWWIMPSRDIKPV